MERLWPFLFAGLLLPGFASGERAITAREFTTEVSTLLDQQTPDHDIAKWIEKSHLSESLSRETIESALQNHSAGPYTIFALDVAIFNAAFLPPPREAVPTDPAPDETTMEAIKTRLRNYARTRRDAWSQFSCTHALTAEANYQARQDRRMFTGAKKWFANPLPTRPASADDPSEEGHLPTGRMQKFATADLAWDHWEILFGQKTAVLKFKEVPGSGKQPAWRGLVYCSPEDGAIHRFVETQDANFVGAIGGLNLTISESDFAPVTLANMTYQFPSRIVTIFKATQFDSWIKTMARMSDFHQNESVMPH